MGIFLRHLTVLSLSFCAFVVSNANALDAGMTKDQVSAELTSKGFEPGEIVFGAQVWVKDNYKPDSAGVAQANCGLLSKAAPTTGNVGWHHIGDACLLGGQLQQKLGSVCVSVAFDQLTKKSSQVIVVRVDDQGPFIESIKPDGCADEIIGKRLRNRN